MIHDYENAAKRLLGFIRAQPTLPSQPTLIRWLALIAEDQEHTREHALKGRFEDFESKQKTLLKRYEYEIQTGIEQNFSAAEILKKLQEQYKYAKQLPKIESLSIFMMKLERINNGKS